MPIIAVELTDSGDGESRLQCRVHVSPSGIYVSFDGYGENQATEGQGQPVGIELYHGVPRVLLYLDINSEEPEIIPLHGAKEDRRRVE